MIEEFKEILIWMAANPVASVAVLFIQFAVFMRIHHRNHNEALHVLLVIWFAPQDIIVNLVAMTMIGLELPREWLVTTRLARWKTIENPKGYREKMRSYVSWRLCEMLNRFDMGHC